MTPMSYFIQCAAPLPAISGDTSVLGRGPLETHEAGMAGAAARTASGKKERILYRFLAIGTLYRGIITYSRGGFLACGVLGLHYLLRTRRKLEAALGIALVSVLVLPVLPG